MTDVISHRGPDGEGFYSNKNISLGHRRLSIIDLSTGDQPMYSDDNSIILVFNGEIYNYLELKRELIALGHTFKTNSDTEVIIKSYQEWGLQCQNRFNGMWAFALWDEKRNQLLLSRDRIGEKPLHYSIYNETIVFGSEIKSLFAYGIPKKLNIELLEIYLALGYIPAPYTFYNYIHKLKPGHCITVTGKKFVEHRYWDLPDIDEDRMTKDRDKIYEQFIFLFNDSVKLRMRSDVPYGAFLSGGLDSSSIVALMSSISSFPVESFTIGFHERSFDERHLAKMVASRFNTNHHELLVEPATFTESLNKVIHHYDEPFGDSSAIPTGIISEFAASKVKMVLTGDGGDEVLSGYTSYQGEKFATQYQKLPKWVKVGIPAVVSTVSGPFAGDIRYRLNRVHDVCKSSNLSFIDRYLSKSICVDEHFIRRITQGMKVFPVKDFLRDLELKCMYKDPFYKLMFFNQKLSLPDDMLVKVDRMSMAYSLETRTPFLDYRLIEFMSHVHKDIKMQHYERKSILRDTIGKKLPESLLRASKKGFSVPLREWFKNGSYLERLCSLNSVLPMSDDKVISELFLLNQNGRRDYGNFIWMLFVLQRAMED